MPSVEDVAYVLSNGLNFSGQDLKSDLVRRSMDMIIVRIFLMYIFSIPCNRPIASYLATK